MRIRNPFLCVLVVSAIACRGGRTTDADAALTPEEELTIGRYLTCVDCIIARDGVRQLAGRKPGATVDTLGRAMIVGPDSVALQAAYNMLQIGYGRDSAWRRQQGLPPLPERVQYVAAANSLYVDGYRAQGAIALGWIHTPRAVHLLDSALTLPLPPRVRRAVTYARDSLPPR